MKDVKIMAMAGMRKKIVGYWRQAIVRVYRNWISFLILISSVLCLVNFLVFAPGFYTYDSIEQLSQVIGVTPLSNWHPVAFVEVWKGLLSVTGHISSMLLFQLSLLWMGLLIIAVLAYKITNSRRISILVLLIGFLPYVYTISPSLLKDVHLAHALLISVAIIAYSYYLVIVSKAKLSYKKRLLMFSISVAFLIYASVMRHGPVVAFFPLVLVASTLISESRKIAYSIFAVVVGILLLAPGLVDRATPGEKVDLQYAIMVDDFVYVANTDDIKMADIKKGQKEYLLRVKAGCPLNSTRISGSILHCKGKHKETYYKDFKDFAASDQEGHVKRFWVKVLVRHPFAYLRYRAASFTKLLFAETADTAWRTPAAPNDIGVSAPDNRVLHYSRNLFRFVLLNFGFGFRGWFWLTVNLVVLVYAVLKRKSLAYYPLIIAIAASGVLYTLQFLPAVVAYGYRYLYWATLSGILSTVLLCLDLKSQKINEAESAKANASKK